MYTLNDSILRGSVYTLNGSLLAGSILRESLLRGSLLRGSLYTLKDVKRFTVHFKWEDQCTL